MGNWGCTPYQYNIRIHESLPSYEKGCVWPLAVKTARNQSHIEFVTDVRLRNNTGKYIWLCFAHYVWFCMYYQQRQVILGSRCTEKIIDLERRPDSGLRQDTEVTGTMAGKCAARSHGALSGVKQMRLFIGRPFKFTLNCLICFTDYPL